MLTATGTMSGTIGAWDTVDVLGVDEASAPEPPTRRSWTRRASGVSHAWYRHILVGGYGSGGGPPGLGDDEQQEEEVAVERPM